jgi:hypothetical protein
MIKRAAATCSSGESDCRVVSEAWLTKFSAQRGFTTYFIEQQVWRETVQEPVRS